MKKKRPELRFSGFDNDWEQRKLGEVLQTLPFENFIKTPEQDGEYEIIQQGNESILGFAKGMPCTDYRDVVIFGDHTMSLYKPHQPFFIATDGVRIIKGKQKMDGFYLMAMLERYRPQSEGYKRYYSILTNTECFFTENWAEQQQIGIYFRQLDHLITLHRCECKKLICIKKSVLENMFPQKGEKIPRIRFSGFTDDWEQRKLGDVSDSYSGGTPTADVSEYYGGQIPFIRSAEINSVITELFLTEGGLKNSSARLVEMGDILYALYGATSGEVGRARLTGAINQAILAIKPHGGYDSEYIAQWLRKSKHSIIETYLQGGQGNLSGAIVKELSVDFPTLKEQQVIGAFFKQLDHLITLHQRKLGKLQNIKKAMLEKMFV